MRFLALLKFVVIILLLATGGLFLVKGLGVDLPLLRYQKIEAQNVPAGIVILLVAIGIARFWRIQTISSVSRVEKKTANLKGRDTSNETIETTTVTERRFMPSSSDDKS
jgi:hypothetical protein